MGARGAEVGIPGVQVRIEVHERDRAVHGVHRAKHRECDGMVPAQAQHRSTVADERQYPLFDLVECFGDVEGIAGNVAGVHYLRLTERLGIQRRVIRAQQS